ncbi:hypothetical protein AB4438_05495, partial [Vibrio breoganii]
DDECFTLPRSGFVQQGKQADALSTASFCAIDPVSIAKNPIFYTLKKSIRNPHQYSIIILRIIKTLIR